MKRPLCINYNCGRQAVGYAPKKGPPTRYRPYCQSCYNANRAQISPREGVIPFQSYSCSNSTGILEFKCPLNKDIMKFLPSKGIFNIDHINGDCFNNDFYNILEICICCHKIKSIFAGDYSRKKTFEHKDYLKRIMKNIKKYKNSVFIPSQSIYINVYEKEGQNDRRRERVA